MYLILLHERNREIPYVSHIYKLLIQNTVNLMTAAINALFSVCYLLNGVNVANVNVLAKKN